MLVEKRNGLYEDVSFDKILRRIESMCNSVEFIEKLSIDHTVIAQKKEKKLDKI